MGERKSDDEPIEFKIEHKPKQSCNNNSSCSQA